MSSSYWRLIFENDVKHERKMYMVVGTSSDIRIEEGLKWIDAQNKRYKGKAHFLLECVRCIRGKVDGAPGEEKSLSRLDNDTVIPSLQLKRYLSDLLIHGSIEEWKASITGNMTLSVLSNIGNERILTIDMLSQNTMIAENEGERLAKALNDLYLLGNIPCILRDKKLRIRDMNLPYPDAGHSPFPWMCIRRGSRLFRVQDGNRRKIAGRQFPASLDFFRLEFVEYVMKSGIECLNNQDYDENQ
jgi:hypothetical protein